MKRQRIIAQPLCVRASGMMGLLRSFIGMVRCLLEGERPVPMLVDDGEKRPTMILANMVAAEILSFQGEIEWRRVEGKMPSIPKGVSKTVAERYAQAYLKGGFYERPREFFTLKTGKITLTGERNNDSIYGPRYSFDFNSIVPEVSLSSDEEAVISAAFKKALEYQGKRQAIVREGERQKKALIALSNWMGIPEPVELDPLVVY